jgi:predicted lipid-binding transport protein (Tim44 family)
MSFAVARTAAAMAALGLALSGCAATSTAVAKRNLDVQTKMSDTIFLDPVTPDERTVYVDVRNTSDQPALDVAPQVRQAVEARGYKVVDDPKAARFVLQANVLQAGRASETAAESAYSSGFGGTLLGGAAGGAAGYGLGKAGLGVNDAIGTVVGALAGAAISSVADAYVQDVTYTLVTDIQVSERVPGTVISQSEQANLKQGTSGTVTQSSSDTTDARRYRTRIVSTANQANLDWPQAEPELVAGLTRSIGGIF